MKLRSILPLTCVICALALGACFDEGGGGDGNTGGDGSGDTNTCVAGEEGCPCLPNLTCFGDLECRNGLCLPAEDDDGSTSGDGSDGSTTSAGTTTEASTTGDGGTTDGSTTSGTTTDGTSTTSGSQGASVYLFLSDLIRGGEIDTEPGGGSTRESADMWCDDWKTLYHDGLPCSEVHAIISIDTSDEIRDMPGNYGLPTDIPVVGHNGGQVGESFAQMMLGNLTQSMTDAGFTNEEDYYWTGSAVNGALYNNHCLNWTSIDEPYGQVGSPDQANDHWLDDNRLFDCNDFRPLLCACWEP